MKNDCVFFAWKAYVESMGVKVGFADRLKFWDNRLSLSRMTCFPGQVTPIRIIPDLIGLLSFDKGITVQTIELDVYDELDFKNSKLMQSYINMGKVWHSHNITKGIFCSLNSHHAYYAREYDGKDWIALAIQLRRWR